MGRIKSKDVKIFAYQLLSTGKFTDDFEKNKILIEEMKLPLTKRMKNKVTGYITRLVKNSQRVSAGMSEEDFSS